MQQELNEKQILDYILKYFELLDKNFDSKNKKKLPFQDLKNIMDDMNVLFNKFYDLNPEKCSRLSTKRYIPLLNLVVKLDKDGTRAIEYMKYLKNAYRMSARTSLESYFIYREWELEPSDLERIFTPRYNILVGYVHYLEEIVTNPNLRLIIANLPSGYGKTYTEKVSEAWAFGRDPTGTVLSMCSNERVATGGSETVRGEMKKEWFGEVFPELAWDKEKKDYFLKETNNEWKLKQCKLSASYYATTTNSNIVGVRASQRIHIDDLYQGPTEAMSSKLNEEYLKQYQTVWLKRFVQNMIPKVIVTGTLWASGDFIALLIKLQKKWHKFKKHPKYKYTWVSEDGSVVIIQVPALDYETGLSTCPEIKTTNELLREKADMDEYLWETNFQQRPTDPEALFFSYSKLRTYETIPKTDFMGGYAVIDATRKSGKDFFAMPIFTKVPNENGYDYYLKDCLFTRTATKDMYYPITEKIMEHHIIELVIESNVTSELKQNIEKILKANDIGYCQIREKYNCENKKTRIELEKGNIIRKLVFPQQDRVGVQSEMGQFMNNLTLYNNEGTNPNDDAPDSCGMFTHEIIEGGSYTPKAIPMIRPF